MPKRIEDPMDAIRADIEKKFEQSVKEMAEEMTFQIESAYESVIQSFYDDYPDPIYRRTGYTYYASNRYDDPFGYTPIGDGYYEAGITVDSINIDKMVETPYRAKDTAWVFERTYAKGIHGFTEKELTEWRENAKIKISTAFALNGSKGQYKKYLAEHSSKFPFNVKRIPKGPMRPTPQRSMATLFKKVTTKRNMNNIFNAILSKNFS